jgi:hypothetical protein
MTPTLAAFLRASDTPTIRETGRLLLVLAGLLEGAGRRADARRALEDAATLLERAASRPGRRSVGTRPV